MIFIANLIGYVLVVAVNALANILPLNGQQTGEISNRLEVLFTPAGYVFSIWGLIYILLGIWVVRQFPLTRRNDIMYSSVGYLFFLSCILNCAWIFCWHYNLFGLSVVVMLLLLVTLCIIYARIKKNQLQWLDLFPFSVYLGWVSVATIANISYWLKYIDWSGFGLSDSTWAMIMIFVAAILAIIFMWFNQDIAYVLVFIWALAGIGVAKSITYPDVSETAYRTALFLGIVNVIFLLTKKFAQPKNRS